MKKLLRLGDMAKGGRERDEVFDLLGMRVVLMPRTDLPTDEAEEAAVQVCHHIIVPSNMSQIILNGHCPLCCMICKVSQLAQYSLNPKHMHCFVECPPCHPQVMVGHTTNQLWCIHYSSRGASEFPIY